VIGSPIVRALLGRVSAYVTPSFLEGTVALHPIPNGDSGPSCFVSASSHRHGSRTSCSASFHPWKSCHVTTGSRAATYVTPWPLWQGLVVVVVVPTYVTSSRRERGTGIGHRVVFNYVVTPPTRWTGLCGTPTIAPYRPRQQPVRTCWSPRLGMAAHLRFQGLPLPALCHAWFQGPRVQFINLEVVGLLTSYHRTTCSLTSCRTFQFNVVVDVPGRTGCAGPRRPHRCCSCFLCSRVARVGP
jgi:hypothetical protein